MWPVVDTGEDLDTVGLVALGHQAALAGPSAVEVGLDVVLGELQPWRAPVEHDAHRTAVGLAEGGDAEERAGWWIHGGQYARQRSRGLSAAANRCSWALASRACPDRRPRHPLPSGTALLGRPDRHPRCPGAQPPRRRPRAAPRPADRVHRAVGLGQVVARVRHHLRRGPASLRRVAVGLRPSVPRPDGQARRRRHRGAVAGDLDRPEVRVAQPPVHRRHGHRDLRLPASAVRPGR